MLPQEWVAMVSAGSLPALPRQAARTRAALIAAARRAFVQNGFTNTRIEDITEDAGYAIGSFYTYFTSKDEIFAEIIDGIAEDALSYKARREPRREKSAPTSAQIVDRLRKANIHFLNSFQSGHQQLWSVFEEATMINAKARKHLAAQSDAYRETHAPLFRKWQRAGAIDRGVDVGATLLAMAGMTNWMFALTHVYGQVFPCPIGVDEVTTIWAGAFGVGSPERTVRNPTPPTTDSIVTIAPGDQAALGPKATATRQTVLDAARRSFSETGLAATGIRELAAAAGLSVGTIYKYFESKQDVLEQMLTELLREMRPHQVDEPPRDKIKRANRAYLAEVRSNPGLWRTLAEAELTNDGVREVLSARRNEHIIVTAHAIEQWQRDATVGSHVDPLSASAMLTGLVEREAHLWYVLRQSPPSLTAGVEFVTDIWWRVLRPR
jgi:AcrR family transcriptional regulator